MTRTSLLLSLLLIPLFVGQAAAADDLQRQRASLISLLSAFELRLDRATLDETGKYTNRALIDIADHPKVAATVRTRAVAALGFYATSVTNNYLRSRLHERSLIGNTFGRQVRRQALRSLGKAFGDRAIEDIIELRQDKEPLIREAVAHALGDTGSKRALITLEAWLPQEPSLAVRAAVDKSIARLKGR